MRQSPIFIFFFYNDTATTEIYTLSLHDALPICAEELAHLSEHSVDRVHHHVLPQQRVGRGHHEERRRSEEQTSELQSQSNLVCRLLLEKKKKIKYQIV